MEAYGAMVRAPPTSSYMFHNCTRDAAERKYLPLIGILERVRSTEDSQGGTAFFR